jgi:proteasome lid subunit RPN8/RPN11
MYLELSQELLREIHAHGEGAYPEEGAGLILGRVSEEKKLATEILQLANGREATARHNRYLLAPEDYLRGEQEAYQRGLEVLGIFHSHPDHPSRPSEYDREWAWPWFSYLITSVQAGRAVDSRSWKLSEDRSEFTEEMIVIFNHSI